MDFETIDFETIVFYQDINGCIHEEIVDLPINPNKEIFTFEHDGIVYYVNAYGKILRTTPSKQIQ